MPTPPADASDETRTDAPAPDAPPAPPLDGEAEAAERTPLGADAPPPPPSDPPPALSAADRLQSRPAEPASRERSALPPRLSWTRLLVFGVVGALIATAAVVWMDRAGEDTDLLGRLVEASDEFQPDLVTTNPDQAAGFVMDAFGWPVGVPDLPDLQLVGVGEAAVLSTPALEVGMPAFRYDGLDDESVVVFVYDYVLLDGAAGALVLPDPMYARLAEDPPVDVRRQSGYYVVTWRERSVLYAAVTEDEATSERIAQAVP